MQLGHAGDSSASGLLDSAQKTVVCVSDMNVLFMSYLRVLGCNRLRKLVLNSLIYYQ